MTDDEIFKRIAGYVDEDTQDPKPDPVFSVLDRLERMCQRDKISERQRTTCLKLLRSLQHELTQHDVDVNLKPIEDWLSAEQPTYSLQESALTALSAAWARLEELGRTPPLRLFLHVQLHED